MKKGKRKKKKEKKEKVDNKKITGSMPKKRVTFSEMSF